jgi:NMD protein affecting ribosome stability and mRNA decay
MSERFFRGPDYAKILKPLNPVSVCPRCGRSNDQPQNLVCSTCCGSPPQSLPNAGRSGPEVARKRGSAKTNGRSKVVYVDV